VVEQVVAREIHNLEVEGSTPSHATKYKIMILQLEPMIPIKRVSDNMEGYAFLVIDYSQEHDLLFTCAMDDGEIWTLNNKEIRFCKNISLDRK
jgi:hypothetical protein